MAKYDAYAHMCDDSYNASRNNSVNYTDLV